MHYLIFNNQILAFAPTLVDLWAIAAHVLPADALGGMPASLEAFRVAASKNSPRYVPRRGQTVKRFETAAGLVTIQYLESVTYTLSATPQAPPE